MKPQKHRCTKVGYVQESKKLPEDTFWGVRGREPAASRGLKGLPTTSDIKVCISPFFGRFLKLLSHPRLTQGWRQLPARSGP